MRRKKLFIATLAAMLLAIPSMVLCKQSEQVRAQSKKGVAAKKTQTLEVSFDYQHQATTSMDVLNKYYLKTNMPVVPSQYWSIAHGTAPGEVTQDEEGMQTMRQLGLNMTFLIKSIRLGLQQFGSPKIQEELTETHYIR